jgi:starch synthase
VAHSICYVTAELSPHAKAGGLGDVSAALTQGLHRRGHAVALFLPFYAALDRQGLVIEQIRALHGLEMAFGSDRYRYSIVRARRGAALPDLLLVDCPALFDRPGLYGSGPDEHLRFLLLSRAALKACGPLGFRPDIVHCHDWHTALLPLYLKATCASDPALAAARSVLTVHNLGYQGVIGHAEAHRLGLGEAVDRLDPREAAEGRINLLRQGLIDADVVSTVSPTYAREICQPDMGMGLDGVLRERGDEVVGILNGVDVEAWDPARDAYLPHRYSAADLDGKARMRDALCDRLGLDPDPGRPVVGMVTRLVWQKGVDLLFDVLPAMLQRRELSLAVLGSGEPAYEAALGRLAAEHPGMAAFRGGHDEELAHWIEAGADAFLMPSRYEPCGLNQMYSMRYGTVPVVRRTGGLADSVRDFDPGTGRGTGILFNDPDGAAVAWALGRMRELFADRGVWRRMMAQGMTQDFGWGTPVERYVELYARAAAVSR